LSTGQSDLPVAPHQAFTPFDAEITDADVETFKALTSTALSPDQVQAVVTPAAVYPTQRSVLAVHWHPETVPLDLAARRLDATFPNCDSRLVIPTDHNVLRSMDDYAGVEVDCYSAGFQRKIQLLVHMSTDRLERGGVFLGMLQHTFAYRSKQLLQIVDTIVDPVNDFTLQRAAAMTGVDETVVQFVRDHTRKFKALLERLERNLAPEVLKNRLLRDYFDSLVPASGRRMVELSQVLLREVKNAVKTDYRLDYFYQTEEVIEEARSLDAGIVVPHPEQFWPVLLADYDVDGYEVWNPQSRQYTDFLINVVSRQNRVARRGHRPILIFMGDDTHLGEKTRSAFIRDEAKAKREIGVQPAWDDLMVRKSLITAKAGRDEVIAEYEARLQ
jgi:hypothetical protein